MKKFLSIFFAVLLFLGGVFCNDMEEVYKIPSLISHYFDHKEDAGEDFDFIDYLVMHYASESLGDSADQELPFYQHNIPALTFTVNCPYHFSILTHPVYFKHSTAYHVFPSEGVVCSFLKPPKA